MSIQLEPETIQAMFITLAEAGKVEELRSLLVNRPRDCAPALGNALIEAAKNGRYDVVAFLLNDGIDVRAVNTQALYEATLSRYDLTRVIHLLKEKGATIDGLEKNHGIDLNHSWVTN